MGKGISTKIRVQDGMSGPLRSMTKALNVALSGFEALQTASSQAVDVSAIHEAQQELARMPSYLDDWEREIEQANREQERLNENIREGGNAADGLAKKVGKLVAAYASVQTVQAALNYTDELTQTEARLKMINKGGDTIDELEDKIRASAKRARATYAGTADIVAKLGQRAGDSFSSNDELIRFTETLNKMFVVAGANAEEQHSASTQLLQALGSGVLRGEEFNAVFESAPNVMEEVAEYMNLPIGKLREMAEDGLITADVVKNALLGASAEVDAAFNRFPVTWEQVAIMGRESFLEGLAPVFAKLQQIGSSQMVQDFATNSGAALGALISVLLPILELVMGIFNFFVENWSIISPIIYGIATALGVYLLATKGVTLAQTVGAAIAGAYRSAQTFLSIGFGVLTGNTAAASAATMTYNSALLASPITWILLIIIAVIAALYAVVAVINKVTGSTLSATGMIMGALATVGAFLVNMLMGALDLVLGFINYLVNPFIAFVNFFGNLFNDPIASIIHLFGDFADNILGVIESIAKALDKVFGSNMAEAVQGWRSGLNEMVENAANKHGNGSYEKVVNELDLSTETFGWERLEYGKSYDWGHGLGENLGNSVSEFFNGEALVSDEASSYQPVDIPPYDEIEKNTGDTVKALETSEEDLKYLRDIAEREAINRFTTAEIRIDMKNDMKVNNGADLNGMINYLEETLYEKMSAAASGVY